MRKRITIFIMLSALITGLGAGCSFDSKNITLKNPKPNSVVSLPFKIEGKARVFEGTVNFRLKDSDNQIIYEGFTTAKMPEVDKHGPYEAQINYLLKAPATKNITLDVFSISAKDGTLENMISVPLVINIPEVYEADIYFNNTNLDPEITCTKVFPVKRIIPMTPIVATDTLNALLNGVSPEESRQGYFTNINLGTKLNDLKINGETVTVDFNEILGINVGGSCRVSSIRAQIEETIKQFSGIKNVLISINGETEEALQP